MPKRSKKHTEALKKVDRTVQYDPKDALELIECFCMFFTPL